MLKKCDAVAESARLSDWMLPAVMNQAGLVAALATPPDSRVSAAPPTSAAAAAAALSLASGRQQRPQPAGMVVRGVCGGRHDSS